jgi:hypothetical protein
MEKSCRVLDLYQGVGNPKFFNGKVGIQANILEGSSGP